MKLETLREFVVFAKLQNFSKAARELHLSQPAMSMHIAGLEKELGFQLVDRRHGITLTPAGQRFLAGIQAALSAYDEALGDCRDLVRAQPAVRVRTTGNIPFLPEMLEKAAPVPVELIEIPIDAYAPFADLEKGLVDIGTCYDFSFSPELEADAEIRGVSVAPIGCDRFFLCLGAGHPLAGKSQLSRNDFNGATVAVLSSKWYDFMVAQCRHVLGEDLDLRFRIIPISSPLALRYVDLGEAVALVGVNYEQLTQRPDVRVFDELDGEPLVVEQMIAYLDENPNPNVHAFVEAVRID